MTVLSENSNIFTITPSGKHAAGLERCKEYDWRWQVSLHETHLWSQGTRNVRKENTREKHIRTETDPLKSADESELIEILTALKSSKPHVPVKWVNRSVSILKAGDLNSLMYFKFNHSFEELNWLTVKDVLSEQSWPISFLIVPY